MLVPLLAAGRHAGGVDLDVDRGVSDLAADLDGAGEPAEAAADLAQHVTRDELDRGVIGIDRVRAGGRDRDPPVRTVLLELLGGLRHLGTSSNLPAAAPCGGPDTGTNG